MATGKIYVGVGGWSFEPWRGVFYPEGLRQKDELAYNAAKMTATEVNATYYSTQKETTWLNWAAATPDDFVFAVKGSRYVTNRRELSGAAESIAKFFAQGLDKLGGKLGPISWQFAPTKKFDRDDMAAFLKLLPAGYRHALEVRNESFDDPAFAALARDAGVAVVYGDHPEYPLIDADTSDFRYARIMQAVEAEPEGYAEKTLDAIADKAKGWAKGGKDVFLFFISGAKVRNPAAAQALLDRLQG